MEPRWRAAVAAMLVAVLCVWDLALPSPVSANNLGPVRPGDWVVVDLAECADDPGYPYWHGFEFGNEAGRSDTPDSAVGVSLPESRQIGDHRWEVLVPDRLGPIQGYGGGPIRTGLYTIVGSPHLCRQTVEVIVDKPPTVPVVGAVPTFNGQREGLMAVAADGLTYLYAAPHIFDSGWVFDEHGLDAPIVGLAANPETYGSEAVSSWLVAADGGVFAIGWSGYFGSAAVLELNTPIVGMAASPTGEGYWLVGADGGVFAFGDAEFFGSTGALTLDASITGITPTPTGDGYWLTAADGGVFAFGDAKFRGALAGLGLNAPVTGIAATESGDGYWLVAGDGGVFTFGDAEFHGSGVGTDPAAPIVALAPTYDRGYSWIGGPGYFMVAADGRIYRCRNGCTFGSEGV